MIRFALPFLASFAAAAAAPPNSFSNSTPMPSFTVKPQKLVPNAQGFDAAPIPNQDAFAPTTRATSDASIAPNVFTRKDQYRGESIQPNSSAQTQEDRKALPGAGFSLRMPLQ